MNERRGHPALHESQNEPEKPREVVQVETLPDPPEVVAPGPKRPQQPALNMDETVLNILKQEMDDLAVRLERFGVTLDARGQQAMVDYAMATLGGFTGGGAIGRR